MFRESWMRVKKIVSYLLFTLLCTVTPSLAADYSILVKNESTQSSRTSLYVQVRTTTTNARTGRTQTQNGRCTALSSYGDGSFYLKTNMEEANSPTLVFYTNRNCMGATVATVSPLEGPEPVANDIIITITDAGATVANSPNPITPPSTAPGGETRPGGPTGPGGGATTQNKRKVIRFFAPWTNTSAILFVAGGASTKMTTLKNYCGWFEARITPPEGSFQVYFKQTIGYDYVGDNFYTKINPTVQSIWLSLDQVAAESDTIWVKANKAGAPAVSAKYPGILGECPTKKLPVMMFDWLHGELGDGDIRTTVNRRDSTTTTSYGNGAKDLYYSNPIYAVSNDFGSGGCGGSNATDTQRRGYMRGMVEQTLGPNGLPVQAAAFPEECKLTTHINGWFVPQVITEKNGKVYSNATCRSIELSLDTGGLWLGQKDNNSPEGGLFLLDDFRYLDEERTIENPFFDNIAARNKRHNFGFTMKIQATFEYVPGQYFEFLGDDDVWVFINNRLVVDIGGQHAQVSGAVDLDTLGLIEGANYPFHIFYAERHTSSSNFMMRTSIDLKTEASMFYQDLSANGLLDYKIYQIVREQALACDFSSNSTIKDTVEAPSNFMLFGSGAYAEGVPLDSVGVWFGGITIKPGYTGFTINTEEIRQKRTLPPGTYQLRFSLQKDESQSDDIWFTIDKYDSPTINYARVDNRNKWTFIGNDVDGTVDTLGKWVNTRYTVNVAFVEDWATFDDMVYITTNNTAVIPCDENGNPITAITLKDGKGTFYIKAIAPVQDIKLIVSSADESQQAIWKNITFMEPPVPQVVYAFIFDRDGDGRGDSVYAKLSKPAGRINANVVQMDSVALEFGEKFATLKKENVKTNDADSSMIITANGGFGSVPFTGGAESVYSGKITPFWTYKEGASPTSINLTSDLTDSIGPVITAADISYSDDGSTVLLLTFSEGLDCENENDASFFTYYFKKTDEIRNDIVPDILVKVSKSKWKLIFRSSSNDKESIPAMGDSIKMVEGVHMDLLHRSTDPRNPFVRISGEQNVVVTSPPVVLIGESDSSQAIIRSKDPTVPKVVRTDRPMTAKEVSEIYGSQGHYLGDLSISSMVKDEITNLESAIKNANAEIVEKEGKTLTDLIKEKGKDAVNKQYHLGDEIMNALEGEIITVDDIREIANGNSSTITKVTKALAEKTRLEYKTMYFTSLGIFVNSTTAALSCSDSLYKGNCLDGNNDGKLFLAWNMKSKEGRLVGTGVYIARLSYKIKVGHRVVVNRTQDFLWGVRHGKTKGFDIDLND